MNNLNWQNLSPVQSDQQPSIPTVASAATIAPETRFTFVSGTTQLETITPPVTGYHEVVLCFTDAAPGAFLTSGNIQVAYQPIQNRPITLCYIPTLNKYYVQSVV